MTERPPHHPTSSAVPGPSPPAIEAALAIAAEQARAVTRTDEPTPSASAASRRIGFVSVWFERGQAVVTRALRDALDGPHQTFVLARTGSVHRVPHLVTEGPWAVPNLTPHPRYEITPGELRDWIEAHRLDVVVFNEEFDFGLVAAARDAGARTVTYLDYWKDDWIPHMGRYDLVLCSTRRTLELVRPHARCAYIGWGVDTDLFRPRPTDEPVATFFHNAGWLGVNQRKMTPAVLLAFDAVSRVRPDLSLFVHAQAGVDRLPAVCQRLIRDHPRITYQVGTVPAPGLYHRGRILLFPTKLEGLGLPLFEGLATGLPVIATDAPPMNEFVTDGENGLLVRVADTWTRHDDIAFPETVVDLNDLAARMLELADDPARVDRMARVARQTVPDAATLAGRVRDAITSLERSPRDRRG